MGMKEYYKGTGRSDEDIIKALEENDWNDVKAASALGYSKTQTLRSRIKRSEKLSEICEGKINKPKNTVPQRSDEEYLKAIYKAKGVKSLIAKTLGLHINSVYSRIQRTPELKEACYIASESFKDIAELKLFELVEQGDFHAIKFYLSTQGRDRGYGEKLEINANMNVDHNWNLQLLGMNELLVLENIARKALPEGDKGEVIDGSFIEKSAEITAD